MMIRIIVITIIFVITNGIALADLLSDHERGWFWYEVVPEKQTDNVTEIHPTNAANATKSKAVSYTELLHRINKDLQEIRARAILDPIPENAAAWYLAQLVTMYMAGEFTKASLLVPMLYPNLDVSSVVPSSEWSSWAIDYRHSKESKEAMTLLANTGVLVVAYRSIDCFLCEKEMEALSVLKRMYGFKIYALYEDFPPGGTDRTKKLTDIIRKKLDIRTFPSVYYFKNGSFHYVGSGALNKGELERRLLTLGLQKGWIRISPLYTLTGAEPLKKLGKDPLKILNYLERLKAGEVNFK